MKTKKQEELANSFLSMLEEENKSLFQDIIMYLSKLGYNPHMQRSYIVFKHSLHNKQMAKMGVRKNKDHSPFFELRFSACKGYPQRFENIVYEAVSKKNFREAQCIYNNCDYCAGEAFSHVYTHIFTNGEMKSHCGAVTLEIPNITVDDIEMIKKLIKDEHIYLMEHQAGITI